MLMLDVVSDQHRCRLGKHLQLRFHVVVHVSMSACEGWVRAFVLVSCVVGWPIRRAAQMLA